MNSTLIEDRIEIMNCMNDIFLRDIGNDVLEGLTSHPKFIPSKYFYDPYGSYLFEKICRLPEYYQTRTEISILRDAAPAVIRHFREGDIIELGSGANLKIRILLDAAFEAYPTDICYVPVDVSESALINASRELIGLYPDLRVRGIIADFTKHIEKIPLERKKLFVFLGSTIGNFTDEESSSFLKNIACLMEHDDRFLLGIDMIKPKEIVEPAYNDSQGITAEFNKNILSVINRKLDADFNKDNFDHLAFYVSAQERVEMYLRAKRNICGRIKVLDCAIDIKKNETIHTEISRKFSRRSAEVMVGEAGLKIERWFSDREGWFSLIELARVNG